MCPRKILIFVLISATGLSFNAQAMLSLYSSPAEIITCEAALTRGAQHTSKEEGQKAIQTALQAIIENEPVDHPADSSHDDLYFSGSLTGMRAAQAQNIVNRLNGIEHDLRNPNTRVFVVRGRNIANETAAIDSARIQLKQIYSKMLKVRHRAIMAFTDAATLAVTLATLNATVAEIRGSHTLVSSLVDAFLPGALMVAFMRVVYSSIKRRRKTLRFARLSDVNYVLERAENGDFDQFYMSSIRTDVPVEFNDYLLNGSNARGVLHARAQVMFHYVPAYAKLPKAAGDNVIGSTRPVYLDQVAYYDKFTNEPVWIFVYRAIRAPSDD